jgi:hypothetical protein
MRESFECAVPIVHHCGVQETRPRGHTALTGACDAQLAVTRDRANNVTVTVEHMKDGPEGDVIASKLELVEVGTNEDGDAITTCLVVPTEVQRTTAAGPHLTKNQETMFSILHDAGGRLDRESWNNRAREAGLGKRRKADLYDLRAALISKRLVYESGGRFQVRHE